MATTDEQYIQKIYDSQKQSALNTLKSAYDNNVSSIDMAKKNTDTTAYDAKREAAGNAAITRQRLNETFAANGLNTGTVGQANLALLNQKAANLNDIETKRVAAQAEYDRQKAQLAQTYQSEVKNAILENDADRAAALYKLYQQQQEAASAARGYSGSGSSGDDIIDDDSTSDLETAKQELLRRFNNGELSNVEYLTAMGRLTGRISDGPKAAGALAGAVQAARASNTGKAAKSLSSKREVQKTKKGGKGGSF